MKNDKDIGSYLNMVLKDCKHFAQSLHWCQLVHVKRQCNTTVVYMSKIIFQFVDKVWLEGCPMADDILLNDVPFNFVHDWIKC